jgi:hypothetical protein
VRSASLEDPHGHIAPAPAPPTESLNVLTLAGPRRTSGAVPPTPPERPSPPLCDAVRRGRRQSHDTVPPTFVLLTRCALERGRRNPRRGNERLLYACPGLRRDVRPAGPVVIGPVRDQPSRHHPGHCIAIPDVVEACDDRTSPRPLLCPVRPHVNSTLESPRGRPPNRQPLHRHPRSRSWTGTGHAMTPRRKPDSPGRPSTPRHCTPDLHT